MRKIAKIEIKNDFVVKGQQFEGVRKVSRLDEAIDKVVSCHCEEIFLIDNTKSVFGLEPNFEMLEKAARLSSLPILFGGGLCDLQQILKAFELGASRVYLNTETFNDNDLIERVIHICGKQAVTGGVEYKYEKDAYRCYAAAGREGTNYSVEHRVNKLLEKDVGEILLTSIDHDGTKKGLRTSFDIELSDISIPVIHAGGGTEDQFENYMSFSGADGLAFSSVVLGL